MDHKDYVISVLFLFCLFVDTLWSPAGKGLTSWLSFVMSNCDLSLSHVVFYSIVSIPALCRLS